MNKEMNTPQKKQGWKLWLGILIGAVAVGVAWLIWYQLTPPQEIEVEKIVEKEVTKEVPVETETEEQTPAAAEKDLSEYILVTYEGDGSAISPDRANQVYFSEINEMTSSAKYFFVDKSIAQEFPDVSPDNIGENFYLYADDFIQNGAAAGTTLVDVEGNIDIVLKSN